MKNKSLIEIHLAVLLFGLAGLFGKLLALPAMIIVLGRVFFSGIFLGIIILGLKQKAKLKEKKHYFYIFAMGVILAVHWTSFFLAIQLSTVAVGLLTFSTFPVFVTFLEPYFFKERLKLLDVILAIITFTGVVLVLPGFQLQNSITQGVIWGLISGLTYAALSMLNRRYVRDYSSIVIAFYEQLSAAVVLTPFLIVQRPGVSLRDILLLMLLGIVFTAIAHSLFINGLRNIRTRTAGIISSLEPVYGIIFAALLIKELPNAREVIGGMIILGTVFYSTLQSK